MSRRKRHNKHERRLLKARKRQQPVHLQLSGYIDPSDYIEWWKKGSVGEKPKKTMAKKINAPKPIAFEDYLQVPWDWEMDVIAAGTRTRKTITSKDKKTKRQLYVEGDTLFLLQDVFTHKMTSLHEITIIDAKNKKFPKTPVYKVIEWATEEEKRVRSEIARQKQELSK